MNMFSIMIKIVNIIFGVGICFNAANYNIQLFTYRTYWGIYAIINKTIWILVAGTV